MKTILDDSLLKCYHPVGTLRMHEKFKFHMSFCCKQEQCELRSNMSGYYVRSLMDEFVHMKSPLRDHASLAMWAIELEEGEITS